MEGDDDIAKIANSLLSELHVPIKLKTWRDVSSHVFVMLFEGLMGEELQGIIHKPKNESEEIKNLNLIIKTLETLVLKTSLNHIKPEKIIIKHRTTISNLLEIFSGLYEYLVHKIDDDFTNEKNNDSEEIEIEDFHNKTQDSSKSDLELKTTADYIALGNTNTSLPSTSADTKELILAGGGELPSSSTQNTNESIDINNKRLKNNSGIETDSDQALRLSLSYNDTDKENKSNEYCVESKSKEFRTLLQKEKDSLNNHSFHRSHNESSKSLSTSDANLKHRRDKTQVEQVLDDLRSEPSFAQILDKYDLLKSDDVLSDSNYSVDRKSSSALKAQKICSKKKLDVNDPIESWKLKDTKSSTWKVEINKRIEASHKAAGLPRKLITPENCKSDHSDNELSECITNKLDRMNKSLDELVQAFGKYSNKFANQLQPIQQNVKENIKSPETDSKDITNSPRSELSERESTKCSSTVEGSASSDGKEADISSFERDTRKYRKQLNKKIVRFDDKYDKKSTGNLSPYRRQFLDEEKKLRRHQEMINEEYEDTINNLLKKKAHILSKSEKKSKETEKKYKKSALVKPKKTTSSVLHKKYAPQVVRHFKPIGPKSVSRKRNSSALSIHRTFSDDPNKLLGLLLKEFPHLDLSSDVLHSLWRSSAQQAALLASATKSDSRSHVLEQMEESERKQSILLDIMRKEMGHRMRIKQIEERNEQKQIARVSDRERKQQSARARRYYNDYHSRIKSKLLRARTKEELLFKQLFKEGLEIQKDRVRELKKYAAEQRLERAIKQKNAMESIENYYKDQFHMLADSFDQDKKEFQIREEAQSLALNKMKMELRKKMEMDIKCLHSQIVNDNDNEFWRNIDADRIRTDMRRAPFTARV